LGDIKVASGSWLVANCADFPSEQNCQLVIMGPADQKDDLVSAAVAHAIAEHGHADSAELREGLSGMIRRALGSFAARAKTLLLRKNEAGEELKSAKLAVKLVAVAPETEAAFSTHQIFAEPVLRDHDDRRIF
jgi:hypothetical protein